MEKYNKTPKPKLIAIVGPTSGGKSELAVKIAKKIKGEIISADSRQIYKGMDLGTGKVEGKWQNLKIGGQSKRAYLYKNIVHHAIDFLDPKKRYAVTDFQKLSGKIIADILKRGKTPIICGGTAHWVDAVVFNQNIPEVKPNYKLRSNLENKTTGELYARLKKLDPERAKTIDSKNPRRLIRALEIVITTGKAVPELKNEPIYKTIWIGINPPQKELHKKITRRLGERLKSGLVKEVESLHRKGVSWKRLESFGLEYKFSAFYLQKKLSREQMENELLKAIFHYAKRQNTWWKRNQDINWVTTSDKALRLAKEFSITT